MATYFAIFLMDKHHKFDAHFPSIPDLPGTCGDDFADAFGSATYEISMYFEKNDHFDDSAEACFQYLDNMKQRTEEYLVAAIVPIDFIQNYIYYSQDLSPL